MLTFSESISRGFSNFTVVSLESTIQTNLRENISSITKGK